jgi:hypothetical protein
MFLYILNTCRHKTDTVFLCITIHVNWVGTQLFKMPANKTENKSSSVFNEIFLAGWVKTDLTTLYLQVLLKLLILVQTVPLIMYA